MTTRVQQYKALTRHINLFLWSCQKLCISKFIKWSAAKNAHLVRHHVSRGSVKNSSTRGFTASPGLLPVAVVVVVLDWFTTAGWWYTHPSEKWLSTSVGMMKFPTEWKITRGYFLLIPPFWLVNSLWITMNHPYEIPNWMQTFNQ